LIKLTLWMRLTLVLLCIIMREGGGFQSLRRKCVREMSIPFYFHHTIYDNVFRLIVDQAFLLWWISDVVWWISYIVRILHFKYAEFIRPRAAPERQNEQLFSFYLQEVILHYKTFFVSFLWNCKGAYRGAYRLICKLILEHFLLIKLCICIIVHIA